MSGYARRVQGGRSEEKFYKLVDKVLYIYGAHQVTIYNSRWNMAYTTLPRLQLGQKQVLLKTWIAIITYVYSQSYSFSNQILQ